MATPLSSKFRKQHPTALGLRGLARVGAVRLQARFNKFFALIRLPEKPVAAISLAGINDPGRGRGWVFRTIGDRDVAD